MAVIVNERGIEALKNAVVIRAAKDYRSGLKYVVRLRNGVLTEKKKLAMENKLADLKQIEDFFVSEYFMFFTDLDGKYLMRKIQRDCGYSP